jgi:hypothetical protein
MEAQACIQHVVQQQLKDPPAKEILQVGLQRFLDVVPGVTVAAIHRYRLSTYHPFSLKWPVLAEILPSFLPSWNPLESGCND